ncbi:hypothetical protein [Saliniradius amylolyticus]|nr:hypothetical protein [Saliniradius amylolyticus]
MLQRLVLICSVVAFQAIAQSQVVRTIGPQDPEAGASHKYYIDLLERVISRTEAEFGPAYIQQVPHPGQGRVLRLLGQNRFYDVMWAGSSAQREVSLKAIPVPLFKGGLGWRGMVILEQRRPVFARINTLEQLSHFVACQGEHWPDSDVLENAGLVVARINRVTAMMEMLIKKRCDYLPLSLFEGPSEVSARQHRMPGLVFYDRLILKYPLTMNFFVHRSNEVLARRMTAGLQQMVQEGELEAFMRDHPVTQHMFPLSQYRQARVFELDNPNYAVPALLEQPEYWLGLP